MNPAGMLRPGRIWTCLFVCLLLLDQTTGGFFGQGATLNATYQNCSNEGQQVEVSLVANNPCITCMCKEGHVQCNKTCASTQGCYMVLQEKTDKCCDVCKGCDYNGVHYSSGSEWSDPSDPCQVLSCQAGVITTSSTACHPQCDHPLPPRSGECCPRCKECMLDGKTVEEGQFAVYPADPCIQCRCTKGTLVCARKSCPVLSCPAAKAVHKPGSCCPECQGKRKVYDPRSRCLLGDKTYASGSTFRPDACTNCTCTNGTSICSRQLCPPIPDCPAEHKSALVTVGLGQKEKADADVCCPKCRVRSSPHTPGTMELPPTALPSMRPLTCSYRGTIYQDGASWSLDPCTQCMCLKGEVRCSVQQCPVYRTKDDYHKNSANKSKLRSSAPAFNNIPASACPPGHHPVKEPGQCCPKCVEDDAVCTVFGDPHYRTFDGRVFNYQGACKYLLTADCKNNTFSVRVTNDGRSSRSFSWTKSVTLMIDGLKVMLGQHMKVKVKNKKVALPFVSLGVLSIVQEGYSVIVRTNIGVKLLWDGESFLEVTVPPTYKGQLCGLCGNYNGKRQDDLRLKNGQLAKTIQQFGASWKVGGAKSCSREDPAPGSAISRASSTGKSSVEPLCQRQWETRIRAVRECNALKSLMFMGCHKKVSPVRFFKSCLLDMCECPPEKQCYCEALTAYSHECGRQGVDINPKWREMTACTGHLTSHHTNHQHTSLRSP